MKIFYIILFASSLLFLSSCVSNLNVVISGMVNDDCVCNLNSCKCEEKYSSDYIYLNCSDIEYNSIIDIVKNCKYVTFINGSEWKGEIITVEKIIEKDCPVIEFPECEVCEVCGECEECEICDLRYDFNLTRYRYGCDNCNDDCFDMCDNYCDDCYNKTIANETIIYINKTVIINKTVECDVCEECEVCNETNSTE